MNRRLLPIFVAALGGLLCFGFWGHYQGLLENRAKALIVSELRGEAAAVWPFVSKQERDLYSLDYSRFKLICDQVLLPALQNVKQAGPVLTTPFPQSKRVDASVDLIRPSGKKSRLVVSVVESEDGAFGIDLVNQLITFAMLASVRDDSRLADPEVVLAGIEINRPVLERLGIHGLRNGSHGYMNWDQMIERQEERFRLLRARTRDGQ